MSCSVFFFFLQGDNGSVYCCKKSLCNLPSLTGITDGASASNINCFVGSVTNNNTAGLFLCKTGFLEIRDAWADCRGRHLAHYFFEDQEKFICSCWPAYYSVTNVKCGTSSQQCLSYKRLDANGNPASSVGMTFECDDGKKCRQNGLTSSCKNVSGRSSNLH